MGHTYTTLGACACQAYKMLGTDVGRKDSHTDYVPGLSLTKEVCRRIFAFLSFSVLNDRMPHCPYHADYANGEHGPVEPYELC